MALWPNDASADARLGSSVFDLAILGRSLLTLLQFLLGVLFFREDMPAARWIGFVLVWVARAGSVCWSCGNCTVCWIGGGLGQPLWGRAHRVSSMPCFRAACDTVARYRDSKPR